MNKKIINRLFTYLKEKGIPHTRFEKEIGLSNGYLKIQEKRNSDLGEGIIIKVIDNCIDLNLEWLIIGKGPMLKSEITSENPESTDMISAEPKSEYHINNETLMYKMYKEEKEENKALLKEIGRLEEKLSKYESIGPPVNVASSEKHSSKRTPATSANVLSKKQL